jgi:uncharacterized RDD family membrane protein YckC
MEQDISNQIVYKPGSGWARFWASIIDSFVIGVPIFIFVLIVSLISGSFDYKSLINSSFYQWSAFLFFVFPYYVYFTFTKRTTIGKSAYGLQVVGLDGNADLKFEQVVIRELILRVLIFIPMVGELLFLINGLLIVFSKQKRGVHDMIAKTQVVKVGPAWPMKKQIIFFGGYIIILVALRLFYNFLQFTF